jgi:hypothetical protein
MDKAGHVIGELFPEVELLPSGNGKLCFCVDLFIIAIFHSSLSLAAVANHSYLWIVCGRAINQVRLTSIAQ